MYELTPRDNGSVLAECGIEGRTGTEHSHFAAKPLHLGGNSVDALDIRRISPSRRITILSRIAVLHHSSTVDVSANGQKDDMSIAGIRRHNLILVHRFKSLGNLSRKNLSQVTLGLST